MNVSMPVGYFITVFNLFLLYMGVYNPHSTKQQMPEVRQKVFCSIKNMQKKHSPVMVNLNGIFSVFSSAAERTRL